MLYSIEKLDIKVKKMVLYAASMLLEGLEISEEIDKAHNHTLFNDLCATNSKC